MLKEFLGFSISFNSYIENISLLEDNVISDIKLKILEAVMRTLELILILLSVITILIYRMNFYKKQSIIVYLNIFNMIILIIHSRIEGIRWQLYPVYLCITLSFLLSVSYKVLPKIIIEYYQKKLIKKLGLIFYITMIIISGLTLYIFPIISIEKPSGNTEVGTISYELTDTKRKETYGTSENENRKIMIQLWYPTDEVKGLKRAPWIEGGIPVSRGIAEAMHFPKWLLVHTTYIMSNSYENAELSSLYKKYPVVIISHDWTGFRNLHTNFAEELASKGYIVISIDHTYSSDGVVFSDGSVSFLDRKALPDRSKTPDFLEYAFKLVSTYSGDIELVIDELEKWNSGVLETPFKDRLDLKKIGLIGHSAGGGGAVKAAIEDYRIKAIIGLDAWVEPLKEEQLQAGLGIPSLFLRSEQWQNGFNNKNLLRIVAANRNDTYFYQIQGTNHFDFTMAYMYSPRIKKASLLGSLDSKIGSNLQKDYITTFFNEYLLHEDEGETAKLQEKYNRIKLLQKAKIIENN